MIADEESQKASSRDKAITIDKFGTTIDPNVLRDLELVQNGEDDGSEADNEISIEEIFNIDAAQIDSLSQEDSILGMISCCQARSLMVLIPFVYAIEWLMWGNGVVHKYKGSLDVRSHILLPESPTILRQGQTQYSPLKRKKPPRWWYLMHSCEAWSQTRLLGITGLNLISWNQLSIFPSILPK